MDSSDQPDCNCPGPHTQESVFVYCRQYGLYTAYLCDCLYDTSDSTERRELATRRFSGLGYNIDLSLCCFYVGQDLNERYGFEKLPKISWALLFS